MRRITLKKNNLRLITLLIGIIIFLANFKPNFVLADQTQYDIILSSKHVYQNPSYNEYPAWEIILNVTGPTPNSTLQEYEINLDYVPSGSHEGDLYSNESLTLYINQVVISNTNSSQNDYTGNINDTLMLKAGDIVDAQFECNTTKMITEEVCMQQLGLLGKRFLDEVENYPDVTIILECNITMGGATDAIQSNDTEWYFEYSGSCSGYAVPGYQMYWLIGFFGITVLVLVIISKKSIKKAN